MTAPSATPLIRFVVLGTRNAKKAEELRELLVPQGIELRSLADYPEAIEVVEDGETFAANAALKASRQATQLRTWVIGEDSGLCVDALDGAPGVYSARYSGPNATDERNNARLLEALADVPLPARSAHYVCHIALADPSGEIRARSEGQCRGRIIFQPRGSNGFGYDPLFEIVELHQTFGQLGSVVKGVLSHRARALRRFLPKLLALAPQNSA
jgi:XTP/dITP diphosphohydrolase